MNDLDTLYPKWTEAINELPWGVAKAFHNVFSLAAEGKTHLVYGRDYSGKWPCLVNTVGVMLKSTGGTGGHGLPSTHFGDVVRLFDAINRELASANVNTEPNLVSPLAADIFLHHFPDLDALKEQHMEKLSAIDAPYVEPNDDELAAEISNMFADSGPCEIDLHDGVHLDVLVTEENAPPNVVLGNFSRPE